MKHGSLFSGIGGFDISAEWMGWENVFHCEWNEFGQKVLKYYWPKAISYADITKTDFSIHRGNIDILTGGFPCQPYSQAGKRLGKEDDRHLWPEMLRAIGEIQPRWVVGENVRGLTNWNGGMVFDEVQADLEAKGYEILPVLFPACAVNAPHRRDRIWFIAYSERIGNVCDGRGRRNIYNLNRHDAEKESRRFDFSNGFDSIGNRDVAYTNSNGQFGGNCEHEEYTSEIGEYAQRHFIEGVNNGHNTHADSQGLQEWLQCGIRGIRDQAGTSERGEFTRTYSKGHWNEFPTQSPICNGDDGISSRLDGITFSKWRSESIKAGGNAIVPQAAHQIFKAIEEYEKSKLKTTQSRK